MDQSMKKHILASFLATLFPVNGFSAIASLFGVPDVYAEAMEDDGIEEDI